MANPAPQQSGGPKTSVKAPLMFSAALAAVAGIVTLVVSTGGTRHELRWDLAAIAFGVAFIVTLVVAAMLSMSHKENAPHLGQGSGINLTSAERLAQQQERDRKAGNDDAGPASSA
ncbi:hypothetical protein [Arthrobacter sp. 35W]|uniref:hypothetical protein n=1 Tax=Arthrobacter sp. 35W TaxID=1132441 RepID=UPI00041C2484